MTAPPAPGVPARRPGKLVRALRLLVALAALPAPAGAADSSVTPPPEGGPPPILGGGARTLPVLARHGMVVAQEGTAARVGVDVLKRGGNAVDAAVATALALAVTLPRAGNLGGGGFMLVHLAPTAGAPARTVAIDYREVAPAAATAGVFLDGEGRADPRLSRDTGLAVGVPGTVAGLALALARYGSGRFTLGELARPAAALARDGIPVADDLADSLAQDRRLRRWPSSVAVFTHPDGSPLGLGETLVQPDLADTLERIGRDGPRGFYEGPVAERLVAAVRAAGGAMTLDDLKGYGAVERAPVSGTYRGHTVLSMPPPSSGGVHVVELLNILEGFPLAADGAGSAAAIHRMAEAMKLAYADRAEYLGDPAAVAVPVKGLTSKGYAAALRRQITDGVRPAGAIAVPDPLPYESDQTTHFSVVDAAGNAVANTTTLNFSFGLGLVAAGTGVLLNNELDDFAAAPGAPNAFGLTGGKANAPGPRKRPLSSMAPLMMFKDGRLELVTGSPGGSRIITVVLEIVLATVDWGMNLAEATAAARVHHQLLPDKLFVERGLSPDTVALLRAQGYDVEVRGAWGSAQSIAVAPDGLLAGAADPRQRGTLAAGY